MKYLLLAFLMLCSCSKNKYLELNKTGVLFVDRMEGTPIVFNNELLYVISNRSDVDKKIEFYNSNKELISSVPTENDLISAFVHNNEVYIYSTHNRESIEMIKSSDLISFSLPIVIKTAPQGINYFNTSVSKSSNGFIMAYETCEPNTTCFNVRFMESTDLVNWTEVGSIFSPDAYAACPTIRQSNGLYYMFYLYTENGFFKTALVTSSDLVSWSKPITFLTPSGDEQFNSSDFDYIEFNGQIFGEYADGDQHGGPTNIRGLYFNGTEQEFLNYLTR